MSNENDELPVVGRIHPIVGFLTTRQAKCAESGAMMDLVLLSDAQRIRDERDRLREALHELAYNPHLAQMAINPLALVGDSNASARMYQHIARAALAGEKK